MTIIIEIIAVSKPGIWYMGKIGNIYEVEMKPHPFTKKTMFYYGELNPIYPNDAMVLKLVYEKKNPAISKKIGILKTLNCRFHDKAL